METLKCETSNHQISTLGIFWTGLILMFMGLPVFSQMEPGRIQEAFKTSYGLERKADYSGAIKSLSTVYEETSYEVNLRLGWLEYQAGFFTESAAYYRKAITLMPYAIEAKFGFVFPASALGNWDQVISTYQEILKIDPQNTIANYRMGSIYYGRQDYSTAEKHLEKVVNLYLFDYDSNILFAWTLFKLGKLRESSVVFNRCLNIRPDDLSAKEGLALIK